MLSCCELVGTIGEKDIVAETATGRGLLFIKDLSLICDQMWPVRAVREFYNGHCQELSISRTIGKWKYKDTQGEGTIYTEHMVALFASLKAFSRAET